MGDALQFHSDLRAHDDLRTDVSVDGLVDLGLKHVKHAPFVMDLMQARIQAVPQCVHCAVHQVI